MDLAQKMNISALLPPRYQSLTPRSGVAVDLQQLDTTMTPALQQFPHTFHILAYLHANASSEASTSTLCDHMPSVFVCALNPSLDWYTYISTRVELRNSTGMQHFFTRAVDEIRTSIPSADVEKELRHMVHYLQQSAVPVAAAEPPKQPDEVPEFDALRQHYGGKAWVPKKLYALVYMIDTIDPAGLRHFPRCVVADPERARPPPPGTLTHMLQSLPSAQVACVEAFHRTVFGPAAVGADALQQYLCRGCDNWPELWTRMRWTCQRSVLHRLSTTPKVDVATLVPSLLQWMSVENGASVHLVDHV